MKYKISNERLKNLIFKFLNQEIEKARFRVFIGGFGFFNILKDDEYDGAMVVVDEDIQIYPAFYQTIMEGLGMDKYQIEDFLTLWSVTELPKRVPSNKRNLLWDKFVEIYD